jgi:hypothetical protein
VIFTLLWRQQFVMPAKRKNPGKPSQPLDPLGSSRSSRDSPSPPPRLIVMATHMEPLAVITCWLDAQLADTKQLIQRDALRDHPDPISVDPPFMPPRPLHARPPLFPHIRLPPTVPPNVSTPRAGPTTRIGRRPTIDPVVVGHAASESADLHSYFINRCMKLNG